jgi:L-aspartate oxidase
LVFGARAAEKMREETGLSSIAAVSAHTSSSSADDAGVLLRRLQEVMWEKAGLLRDAGGLHAAQSALRAIGVELPAAGDRSTLELRNLHAIGELIVRSALAREESRGAHYRNDFPQRDDGRFLKHSVVSRDQSRVRFEAD